MGSTTELQFDDHGFAVNGRRASWDDVEAIVTYKVDCIVHDEIVVAIRLANDRGFILGEEPCGSALIDLMSQARQRFPTIPEDWYFAVMLPPFATNYRVLWHKPGTPPPPAAPGSRPPSWLQMAFVILVIVVAIAVLGAAIGLARFIWHWR